MVAHATLKVDIKAFADETTFHGLKELLSTAFGNITKTLWFLVLLICLALMVFEVVQTSQEFMGSPTATRIKFEQTKTFPPIAYCPFDWLDKTKVQPRWRSGTMKKIKRSKRSLKTVMESISTGAEEALQYIETNLKTGYKVEQILTTAAFCYLIKDRRRFETQESEYSLLAFSFQFWRNSR